MTAWHHCAPPARRAGTRPNAARTAISENESHHGEHEKHHDSHTDTHGKRCFNTRHDDFHEIDCRRRFICWLGAFRHRPICAREAQSEASGDPGSNILVGSCDPFPRVQARGAQRPDAKHWLLGSRPKLLAQQRSGGPNHAEKRSQRKQEARPPTKQAHHNLCECEVDDSVIGWTLA